MYKSTCTNQRNDVFSFCLAFSGFMYQQSVYPLISNFCLFLWLQLCSPEEHKAVDKMIDSGKVEAGTVQRQVILSKHFLIFLKQ